MNWLKGLKILVVEEAAQPGSFSIFYQRGQELVSPEYTIDQSVRQAVAYDEKGEPVILLSQLTPALQRVFPAHTWAMSAHGPIKKPVRAGGLG